MTQFPSEIPRKLVVVVPAYNEASSIAETVGGLRKAGALLAPDVVELLVYVVDDGSTDDTAPLATTAGADRVLRHARNLGLGAAVRTGMTAARDDEADIAVKFDADQQHDPDDIAALIRPILDDTADVVYGDRTDGIEYRMPLLRRCGNHIFMRLMRWLTGWPLRDSQPGILAVNRSYLKIFYLPGDYNYTQQILLDAYHKHMRFAHAPVTFRERTGGQSFISVKYPFKVLPQILMVLVSIKPMKVFAPIGLAFLAVGGVTFAVELIMFFMGHTSKPVLHVNATLGCILFGLQTLFFGILAELIVRLRH